MFYFTAFLVLATSVAILYLAILVLQKNKNKKLNRVFFLAGLSFFAWAISLLLYALSEDTSWATIWIKIVYIIGMWLMLSLIYFSYLFPTEISKQIGKIHFFLLSFLATIIIPIIIFSRDFIVNVTKVDWGYETKLGFWYIAYGLIVLYSIIILVGNVLLKRKEVKGRERMQMQILTIGMILFGVSVSFLDIVLPIFYGISKFFFISPATGIFFVGAVAYSILKLRLMDVRFVYRRVLTILYIGLLSVAFYLFMIFLTKALFGSVFTKEALILASTATLLVNSILTPAREYFQEKVVTKIIKTDYNPLRVRDHFVAEVSGKIQIEELIDLSLNTFKDLFGLQRMGLILLKDGNNKDIVNKFIGYNDSILEGVNRIIVTLGKQSQGVFVREELVSLNENSLLNEDQLQILMFMMNENISVILRLGTYNKSNGYTLLGEKSESGAYTTTDIDLIKSLAQYISLAVSRAFLYQETQNFAKSLEVKVDEATKQLKEKVQALEVARKREQDLLDILGHELRTPLSIIKSAIGLIRLKKKKSSLTPEDIDKNLDAAEESLEREIQIVDTLLGVTKLEANRLELHPEEVDIIDVVEDGIEAHKREISMKKLAVDFRKPETAFPTAIADRTKIQEVFDNLLSNAVKYTNKGSVEITLDQDEDLIFVSVKDTGVGIPKEDLKKLGTKFYRIKQYSQEGKDLRMVRPGGSGLGLYVTFGYVRAMGGSIKVKSEFGKGSTFTFSIPKYKGQKVLHDGAGEKDVFKRMGLQREQSVDEKSNR